MPRPSRTRKPAAPLPATIGAAEVARRANVSIVTVSRAFNDSPLVSVATRERVLAAARELGYRPNSAARALSKGRTNNVAVVLKPGHLAGQFHSELLGGIHSVICHREMSMLLAVAPENENPGHWLRHLVSGAAFDGFILHHSVVREVGPELVHSLRLPTVVAGLFPQPGEEGLELSAVGFDHVSGIQQAVRHLVALGHRGIAFLGSPQFGGEPSTREQAFRNEMKEAGLAVREKWIVACSSDLDAQAGTEAIQKVLGERRPYPTAVICGTDALASGAVCGARAWGLRVPEDLSVVGYGDLPWSSYFTPPLTTVHQRGYELGTVLGEKLLALLDGRPEGLGVNALPMRLVVRQSTAPPPGKK